jgi:hypothetical protein
MLNIGDKPGANVSRIQNDIGKLSRTIIKKITDDGIQMCSCGIIWAPWDFDVFFRQWI